MKTTMIHGTLSWTIEKADALAAPTPDLFAGSDGMYSAVSNAEANGRSGHDGYARVSLILAVMALLLGAWLFTACTDTPPDAPVDPIVPHVMDTTSHDFVWTVDTIGMELSWINDVTIISENDVWVVGMFDQRGDDGRYDINKRGNAAHWDGERWTIFNITDGTYVGGGELEVAFATSPSNIWFASGGPLHFDGIRWSETIFWKLGYRAATKDMWISPDSQIRVFVGNDNSVMYYSNGEYVNHTSAPGYSYLAVDGFSNGDVLIGGGHLTPGVGKLYRMTPDGEFTHVYTHGKYLIRFVDVVDDNILYGTNRELYHFDGKNSHQLFSSAINIHGMEANSMNDVFMITNSSTVYHYNGVSVRDIGPDFPDYCMGMGLCVRGDLIYFVALGNDQRALIFRGERRN